MQNGIGSGSGGRIGSLSRTAQLIVLAVAAIVLVFLFIVVPGLVKALGAVPEPASVAPPPGTFRPTSAQWRALSFARVDDRGFAPIVDTEGQIATDDDVTVQITPPFTGRVLTVLAKAGDRVAKGQTLLTAQASELAQVQNDVAAAQAALTAAQAQRATSRQNAERQRALLQISGAATKDVQQAASDLATAESNETTDEAVLKAARDRLAILNVGPQGLSSAGAVARLSSPLSGVVTMRAVGPGQYLNATANGATTPIFTVSDLSKLWLVANVREDDAGHVHVGDSIRMHVIAFPGRTFEAKLDYVAPMIDPTTRRLPVRALIANPGGVLKPQMFADFAVKTGQGETAASVPSAAVIYEGDQARVWIAQPGRTLALRQIKAGRTADGQVEVLSGLNPGDQVVVAGAIFIDRAAASG